MPDERFADIVRRIEAMPASGGDPAAIARLIGDHPDPELFWAICDWGTTHPFAPKLQAMIEMLFRKDIALHPHAVGETLDQLAYHAPDFIVDAYLARVEALIADDPAQAARCWTDLTMILGERMTAAGRADLASRIAPIDEAVERILLEEDRRAMDAAFTRFDPVSADAWGESDLDAAMTAFSDCDSWWDGLRDWLTALEARRPDPFWDTILMRAITRNPACFRAIPDAELARWIAGALNGEDDRAVVAAAQAGVAAMAARATPELASALETAGRRAAAQQGIELAEGRPSGDPSALARTLFALVAAASRPAAPTARA